MLEVDGVVKQYDSGGDELVRALDGVSLSVAAGELVALYGPSGSGKTTLLKIVAALMCPDYGFVRVRGRDVLSLSPVEAARYRRTELGYVSQSPDLLDGGSAVDNAALKLIGLRAAGSRRRLTTREAHRRVVPLLERLGLGRRLGHRPDQLSAGERQRVLIARALSTNPRLLLADEPTGNLDARRGRQVLAALTEVCREREVAMLVVTHDPEVVAFADRAHELRDGRLCAYQPDRRPLGTGP